MCGHTHDPVIYSKFHQNPFKGFGTPGGQNLALPITLASRFYNSLYYRTSRDDYIFMHSNITPVTDGKTYGFAIAMQNKLQTAWTIMVSKGINNLVSGDGDISV